MADVFISYHEKSAGELVAQIAAELEKAQISCWYAGRDLTDISAYAETIIKSIRNCKVFLLVLNEGSSRSRHVLSEVRTAFNCTEGSDGQEAVKICPFRIDNCKLSDVMDYYIGTYHIIDGDL